MKRVEYFCQVKTVKGRVLGLENQKMIGLNSQGFEPKEYSQAKWEYLRAIENNDPRIETVMVIKNEFDGDELVRSSVVDMERLR